MALIALKGSPINTNGDIPRVGTAAPSFTLVASDLSDISLESLSGRRVVLNIFPSIDTGVCSKSVIVFNQRASELDNTVVVCVSADLPFAASRFCQADGIENVITGSTFRNPEFLDDYGVRMLDGPLAGLSARAVVVIGTDGVILHTQIVSEIATEPDYDSAIAVLSL